MGPYQHGTQVPWYQLVESTIVYTMAPARAAVSHGACPRGLVLQSDNRMPAGESFNAKTSLLNYHYAQRFGYRYVHTDLRYGSGGHEPPNNAYGTFAWCKLRASLRALNVLRESQRSDGAPCAPPWSIFLDSDAYLLPSAGPLDEIVAASGDGAAEADIILAKFRAAGRHGSGVQRINSGVFLFRANEAAAEALARWDAARHNECKSWSTRWPWEQRCIQDLIYGPGDGGNPPARQHNGSEQFLLGRATVHMAPQTVFNTPEGRYAKHLWAHSRATAGRDAQADSELRTLGLGGNTTAVHAAHRAELGRRPSVACDPALPTTSEPQARESPRVSCDGSESSCRGFADRGSASSRVGDPRSAWPCAAHGAVAASFATVEYGPSITALAHSATGAGFPCLVSLRGTWPPASGPVRYVESGVELLPRAEWCNASRYGWRLTHLYKPRLWRLVLSQGLDMLYLDCDYRLVQSPVPALRGLGVDVVAGRDAGHFQTGHLNIGRVWLRATSGTRSLVATLENRTWGAWDQFLFNEELDWNTNASEISCCHGGSNKSLPCTHGKIVVASRDPCDERPAGRDPHGRCMLPRFENFTERRCNVGSFPRALGPPARSRYHWAWDPYGFNAITNHHRLAASKSPGRCTNGRNVCPPC